MRGPDRRVAAVAERFGLDAGQLAQLEALLDCLVEDPHAPTAVRDRAPAVNEHLADSLSGLESAEVRGAATIVDIGSGAGLPGLPLAIALPHAQVTLVEATARKCEFISAATGACGLGNVEVVAARAEAWPDGIGRFDVVTARALARLDIVAEYAAPLLRAGGSLVAWRGRRDPEDDAAGRTAAEKLGLAAAVVIPVTPYDGAQYRHLHVMRKITDTPATFPRREGMARKRPLGGPLSAPESRRGPSSDRARR